jgi:carbonic anhydrase
LTAKEQHDSERSAKQQQANNKREKQMCKVCQQQSGLISRRSLGLFAMSSAALLLASGATAKEKEKPAPPKPENQLSPDAALKRLLRGNERYVEGVMARHDFKREREALVGGQNPYAAILSCADSRIAPEYAFDTGRGDLFVCRVAGNFAGTETIASMEYAVAVLNAPLILVLGHDSCGAVDAALKAIKDNTSPPGHIPSLVDAIAPAAKAAMQQGGDVLNNAIRQNVIDNVAKLKSAAPILNAAVEQGKLKVVGGIYRLTTGTVELIAQG